MSTILTITEQDISIGRWEKMRLELFAAHKMKHLTELLTPLALDEESIHEIELYWR